ncbi:ATP-dependent DNA helicase DDX31 [Ciona intestinalis]
MAENLTLNIFSDGDLQPAMGKLRYSNRAPKDRKKRILQRRKLKKKLIKIKQLKAEDTAKNSEKTTSNDSVDGKQSENSTKIDTVKVNSKVDVKVNSGYKLKPTKQGKIRSSLFSANPEIPALNLPVVNDVPKKAINSAPVTSFSHLNLHLGIESYILEKLEFTDMTEVQSKSLPVLLDGKDALIRSQTGSGKTIAYALAVVQNLQGLVPRITRMDGPAALVFVPTRELALQSYEVFSRLTLPVRRIVATCVVGGQKRKSEKARLRKGSNIIVSTPGRFIDHIENTHCLSLAKVKWIIFDEADRLLDMGFQKDINKILTAVKEQTGTKQQVVLLSATLTNGVENLVNLALTNPVHIETEAGKAKEKNAQIFVDPLTGLNVEKVPLPSKLTQSVTIVPSKLRLVTLVAFINKKCVIEGDGKLLIFLSCRDSVEFHFKLLKNMKGILNNAISDKKLGFFQLHGGMTQPERNSTINGYRCAKSGVLLCTDVASRGLDIPKVDWVVQHTSPGNPVDYVHRVGRTARAGKAGHALLILSPAEADYVKLLTKFDIVAQELKLEEILFGLLEKKQQSINYNIRIQLGKEEASKVHRELEELVHGDKSLKEFAGKAFVAYVRSYATYPAALKHIFHVQNLHLGHVAKSFALQEAPSEFLHNLKKTVGAHAIRQIRRKKSNMEKSETDNNKTDDITVDKEIKKKGTKRHPIVAKFDLMSEFSSGITDFSPSAKKKKVK